MTEDLHKKSEPSQMYFIKIGSDYATITQDGEIIVHKPSVYNQENFSHENNKIADNIPELELQYTANFTPASLLMPLKIIATSGGAICALTHYCEN